MAQNIILHALMFTAPSFHYLVGLYYDKYYTFLKSASVNRYSVHILLFNLHASGRQWIIFSCQEILSSLPAIFYCSTEVPISVFAIKKIRRKEKLLHIGTCFQKIYIPRMQIVFSALRSWRFNEILLRAYSAPYSYIAEISELRLKSPSWEKNYWWS